MIGSRLLADDEDPNLSAEAGGKRAGARTLVEAKPEPGKTLNLGGSPLPSRATVTNRQTTLQSRVQGKSSSPGCHRNLITPCCQYRLLKKSFHLSASGE